MNYDLMAVKLLNNQNETNYGLLFSDENNTYLLNIDLKSFNQFNESEYLDFEKKQLNLTAEEIYELKMNILEFLQLYSIKTYLVQQVDLILETLQTSKKLNKMYKEESFLNLLRDGQIKNKSVRMFLDDVLPGEKNGNKLKRKLNDLHAKNELLNSSSIYKKIDILITKNF